jgi:hypothetical protein
MLHLIRVCTPQLFMNRNKNNFKSINISRVEVETSKVSSQILEVDYTLSMTNDIDATKICI